MQVLAVGILLYESALEEAKKNNDTELVKFLTEYELPLKLSFQLHDIGHASRSHITEKAIPGQKNDEYTKEMLMHNTNTNPEIRNFLVKKCGKDVHSKILEILGREDKVLSLHMLKKLADELQYQTLGDFITVESPRIKMPVGSIEKIKSISEGIRFFKEDGVYKLGHTEEGALKQLARKYNRLVFYAECHENMVAFTEADLLYAIGLSAYLSNHREVTSADIKKCRDQDKVDKMALEGIDSLGDGSFSVEVELLCGGESGAGSDPEDPKSAIYCVTSRGVQEITDRLETVIRKREPELYKHFTPVVRALTSPREVRVNAEISNNFNFDRRLATLKFRPRQIAVSSGNQARRKRA